MTPATPASTLTIEPVDPHDEAAFARWFAPFDAAQRFDRTGPGLWTAQAQRGIALATTGGAERRLWLAAAGDGTPLGAVRLTLPHRDNRTTSQVTLAVDPAARRRGVGSRLLDVALDAARAAGRATVHVQVEEPPDGDGPGSSFARTRGFAPALAEVRRELVLPPDGARLAALDAQVAERAAAYRLVSWVDAVPDPYVDDRAALAASISLDAPTGELAVEREVWDAQRVREAEAQARSMGRRIWGTGAVSPEGRMVAVNELAVDPAAQPELVWNWDTVVLPGHRGRRLGLLVKLGGVRTVLADWPAAERIVTFNAASNGYMIGINEALGFVVAGAEAAWQRRL